MALFVRRSPPVPAAPRPDWPVYQLFRTPGGRDLLQPEVAARILDPDDALGLPAAAEEGDGGSAAASSTATQNSTPQLASTVAAVVLFAIGAVVGVLAFGTDEDGPTFVAAAGIGAFALFYVVAQSAERLAELLIPSFEWLPGLKKDEKVADLERKVAAALNSPAGSGDADQQAADAQAAVDQARANRTAVVFGFTAAVGMALCGYLEADFLTAVGVSFGDADGATAPSTTDQAIAMVVTGLIVGGGSKGLHDLISNVSKASSSKDTPKETGGDK